MSIDPKLYDGTQLEKLEDHVEPLIHGVLWERDVVQLLGQEKAGKSLLALQMALSLTSADPFLDKYEVVRPTPILYLQTEGKLEETVRRLKIMSDSVAYDPRLFHLIYKKFMPLDVIEYKDKVREMIYSITPTPKVMFIDSLYTTMLGDLNENLAVRSMVGSISDLMEEFKMTCVFIHHEKKESYDQMGNVQHRGDKSSYGSVFLRAWVEHILYLENVRGSSSKKKLSCTTDRTGRARKFDELNLVQPNPLYFEVIGHSENSLNTVEAILRTRGTPLSREEIRKLAKTSQRTIDRALSKLIERHVVAKDDESRPVTYQIRGESNG